MNGSIRKTLKALAVRASERGSCGKIKYTSRPLQSDAILIRNWNRCEPESFFAPLQ